MKIFYQNIKNAECVSNEKNWNKSIGLLHIILGRRTWTNANGKPAALQDITLLLPSGILNQICRLGDFVGKPLHGQWTWKQKELAEVGRQVRTSI